MSCKYLGPALVDDSARFATVGSRLSKPRIHSVYFGRHAGTLRVPSQRTSFGVAALVLAALLASSCSADSGDALGATDADGLTPASGSEPITDAGDEITAAPEVIADAALSPPTLPDGVEVVIVDPATGTTSGAVEQPATTVPPAAAPQSEETATNGPEIVPAETSATLDTSAGPVDLESGEALSFTLINELRAELGLGSLERDSTMDAFARDWSRTMAQTGELVHSTANYSENIAFTSNLNLTSANAAGQFHEMWVNSPGHYANMSNEGVSKIGVGLFKTEKGWYGTHVFQ